MSLWSIQKHIKEANFQDLLYKFDCINLIIHIPFLNIEKKTTKTAKNQIMSKNLLKKTRILEIVLARMNYFNIHTT